MPIHENGFVNKLIQQEALVIKKKQFDTDYFTTASPNAIMFNMNLVHEMGKEVWLFGDTQWGEAGDTCRVGCVYSGQLVYREFFRAKPDYKKPDHRTKYGKVKSR